MRKRNSFVSNSSSASFIVTVEKNKFELCDLLMEEISDISFYCFEKEIEENIIRWKKRLEENQKYLEELDINSQKYVVSKNIKEGQKVNYENMIKNTENYFDFIKPLKEKVDWTKEEKWSFFHKILQYHHIWLNPFYPDSEDTWQFKEHTTIHNDYESFSELIRAIVIVLNIKNVPIKCEVIDEN